EEARGRAEQVRGRHVDQLLRGPGAARSRRRAEQRAAPDSELPEVARGARAPAADDAAESEHHGDQRGRRWRSGHHDARRDRRLGHIGQGTSMKRALIGLLIVGAIGAGAGAYYIRRGGPEIQVNTAPITRGDIIDSVGATGTLQAVTTVQVGSQVSGNIQWLGADFNSIVKKGQVIARLD